MPPTFSIGPKLPFAVADKEYPLAEFRKSVFAENLALATATDPPTKYYTSVTSNTDRARLVLNKARIATGPNFLREATDDFPLDL